MEYGHSKLTIEGQLQKYERHPDKSERSATLWHAWHQNKSWLIRLLELTLASFPSYSRHDASHAEAVLHNIERVLGEKRIGELSATDCFAILHTVYVHDIGMAILAADREKIVMSDEFVEMIDMLAEGADKDLKKAAQQLKKNVYYEESNEEIDFDGLEYHNKKKDLYKEKLETYYAVVQLLAEYQRKRHGEKAASGVKDWLLDGDKLRSEFSMSGIPMRIFFRIADCASLHTDWDFEHIMNLPPEENGYEIDMLHPRFVAVLLQLGDALDIDNDRFHPFAEAFLGQFPLQSQAHYDKHLAIRTLKITPEEILIEADCKTREAMRLIKNECDGIENLLKSASYYWSSIAPRGFSGALPSFISPKLLLDGKEIPLDLAMTRFRISQQKAFSLLQGENIYSGYFPFVRELLQNAIDSTKLQCYEDYKTSSKFRFENSKNGIEPPNINGISKIINPVEYPIEISIKCCRFTDDDYKEIDIKDVPDNEEKGARYGILFSIKDYGTGIDTKTLRAISSVGTSYKERKKMLREIPDWLRPTGEFGIGLQSVFLVSDRFYCDTYVRNGERYRIEFLTGANGEKGYINVEPKDAVEEPMSYGTEFRVFISHDKKKVRSEFMDAWTGFDPFTDEYENEGIRRDIIALTVQIILDVDSQLEDMLFPVYASVRFDLGKEQRDQLRNKLSKIVFSDLKEGESYSEENLRKHICWMYQHDNIANVNGNIKYLEVENGICMVDLWKMQINLWLEDVLVNACLGVDRLVQEGLQIMKSPCKLYYKGILIETRYIEKSGNLLEYIDIQGGRRGRKLIQLNRNGFTKEGELYIDTVIIPKIYEKLMKVLKTLANQQFQKEDGRTNESLGMAEKVKENIQKALNEERTVWQRQLVGISLYYNFYMQKYENDRRVYSSMKTQTEKKQWDEAIRNVSGAIQDKSYMWKQHLESGGHVTAIELYANQKDKTFIVLNKRDISSADFYDRRNKFAVVSKRRDKGDKWINSLVWLKGAEKDVKAEDGTKIPIPKLIEVLEKKTTETVKWSDKEQNLENWADFILENIESIIEHQSVAQSDLVLGLLQSVSISACFSDENGNLKVHILAGQSARGVFYNVHAKYMLLKKMAERNSDTHAKRFAGNVWMGYDLLQVVAVQEDVCNIKEKYIGQGGNFMLMPCSGAAVQELINFAESRGNRAEISENAGDNKKEADLDRNLLITADALFSCMTFDYESCISEDQDLFERQYAEHCTREKELLRKKDFVEQLEKGYSLLLRREFRLQGERLENQKQETESVNTGEQNDKLMLGKDSIDEIRKKIIRGVLQNEELITNGKWVENNGEISREFKGLLEELVQYCYQWKRVWSYVEEQRLERKVGEIKKKFWTDSKERENLISWTAEMCHCEQDVVEEFYEQIWEDFKKVVAGHRKGDPLPRQQYKLLMWMEK